MVTDLAILEVAFDQSIIDVDISGALGEQSLEQHVGRDQELLLLVDELERAVTVAQVVKCDRLGEHVIPDTPHLHGVGCEELASVDEAAARERHWVVPLVHDEHPDDALVAVDDEVAAELVHVLLLLDELLLGHAAQVTVLGANHDRNLTNADVNLLWVLIINSSAKCRVQRRLVCQGAHTAFSRVDLLLLIVIAHE